MKKLNNSFSKTILMDLSEIIKYGFGALPGKNYKIYDDKAQKKVSNSNTLVLKKKYKEFIPIYSTS